MIDVLLEVGIAIGAVAALWFTISYAWTVDLRRATSLYLFLFGAVLAALLSMITIRNLFSIEQEWTAIYTALVYLLDGLLIYRVVLLHKVRRRAKNNEYCRRIDDE